VLLVMLMKFFGFGLRFLAMIFYRLGRILIDVYDIAIVLPLMLERWFVALRSARPVQVDVNTGSA
jgi:hypothetical protein